MKHIILFAILFSILISCDSRPKKIFEETIFQSNSAELKTILKKYEDLSKDVSLIYKNNFKSLELYLQLNDSGIVSRVPNFDQIPEAYSATFNLMKNKSYKIFYIGECPHCESGDWYIVYESYFDENGNLIAFVRNCNFFNGECAGVVYEKSEYFYNMQHIMIKKTYEITDKDKKPLDYKKCVFNYRFKYSQCLTLSDYLKNHKFKN